MYLERKADEWWADKNIKKSVKKREADAKRASVARSNVMNEKKARRRGESVCPSQRWAPIQKGGVVGKKR